MFLEGPCCSLVLEPVDTLGGVKDDGECRYFPMSNDKVEEASTRDKCVDMERLLRVW